MKIDILLATYNSEKYLNEQIDSIIAQDYTDWRLLIRDGGSSDSTMQIVGRYIDEHPDKIMLVPSKGNSSALKNFSELLKASEAELVMFSDHDDVWMKDKISRTLAAYRKAESESSPATPILVFTDKIVVDSNLNRISDSYFRMQNLDPKRIQLNYLMFQNVASGCTMLFNRELKKIASPIPAEAVMHDHWLSLCSAAFGKTVYLNEPTMFYRQHGNNVFGASKYGIGYFISKLNAGLSSIKQRQLLNIRQGQKFHETYTPRLSAEQNEKMEDFCRLSVTSFITRRKIIISGGFWKNGLLRNIGLFLFI